MTGSTCKLNPDGQIEYFQASLVKPIKLTVNFSPWCNWFRDKLLMLPLFDSFIHLCGNTMRVQCNLCMHATLTDSNQRISTRNIQTGGTTQMGVCVYWVNGCKSMCEWVTVCECRLHEALSCHLQAHSLDLSGNNLFLALTSTICLCLSCA